MAKVTKEEMLKDPAKLKAELDRLFDKAALRHAKAEARGQAKADREAAYAEKHRKRWPSAERFKLETEYGTTIQVVRDAHRDVSRAKESLRAYKGRTRFSGRSDATVTSLENRLARAKKVHNDLKAPAAALRKELAQELGGVYRLNLPVDNFFVKIPSIVTH
jgi:hypothetical protein